MHRGERADPRDDSTRAFIQEIEGDHHTYSRFHDEAGLLHVVRERLKEHVLATYEIAPKPEQDTQARQNLRSASDFERKPVASLTFGDLDLALATEMIAAAEDTVAQPVAAADLPRLLLSRGYLWWDAETSTHRPTVAGALLLAENPARAPELTQSRLQLDAYPADSNDDDAVDSVFVDAPLPKAIEQAVSFIRRNTARPLVVKGLKRQETELYPSEALREVLVNAVAHRDYAEGGAKVSVELFAAHLRVSSPGLPPGGQSIETLAEGRARSRARNPLIVQGLAWLGFMDERGSGIRRMKRALEQAGLPPPRFSLEHDCVTVDFQAASAVSPDATASSRAPRREESAGTPSSHEEAILQIIDTAGGVTTATCVQKLGISRDTAWRTLARMVDDGVLEKTGTGRATRYRRRAAK